MHDCDACVGASDNEGWVSGRPRWKSDWYGWAWLRNVAVRTARNGRLLFTTVCQSSYCCCRSASFRTFLRPSWWGRRTVKSDTEARSRFVCCNVDASWRVFSYWLLLLLLDWTLEIMVYITKWRQWWRELIAQMSDLLVEINWIFVAVLKNQDSFYARH